MGPCDQCGAAAAMLRGVDIVPWTAAGRMAWEECRCGRWRETDESAAESEDEPRLFTL